MLNYCYNPLKEENTLKGILTILDFGTPVENCLNELLNSNILSIGDIILIDNILSEESSFSPFRFLLYQVGKGLGEERYTENISETLRNFCDITLKKFPSSILNSKLSEKEKEYFLS